MVDRSPQAAVGGCLARVFSLFGFFLLASAVFATIRNLDGPGGGVAFSGALLPGLALIALGRLIRRRAKKLETAESDVVVIQPSPQTMREDSSPPPATPKAPPPRPVPKQIAEVLDEDPAKGDLEAIEELEMDDFKPGRPMSSEERIKRAREKYQKRP